MTSLGLGPLTSRASIITRSMGGELILPTLDLNLTIFLMTTFLMMAFLMMTFLKTTGMIPSLIVFSTPIVTHVKQLIVSINNYYNNYYYHVLDGHAFESMFDFGDFGFEADFSHGSYHHGSKHW